jgi:DNA modification methylase
VPNSEVDSKDHPTSKPTRLFSLPIEMHTKPGDVCYEPFAGSGSQFIAAEMLRRRCYGIEIEPRFCDVIVKRWENVTGNKATLAHPGATGAPRNVAGAQGRNRTKERPGGAPEPTSEGTQTVSSPQ